MSLLKFLKTSNGKDAIYILAIAILGFLALFSGFRCTSERKEKATLTQELKTIQEENTKLQTKITEIQSEETEHREYYPDGTLRAEDLKKSKMYKQQIEDLERQWASKEASYIHRISELEKKTEVKLGGGWIVKATTSLLTDERIFCPGGGRKPFLLEYSYKAGDSFTWENLRGGLIFTF